MYDSILENREFCFYFQPIKSGSGEEIKYYECLLKKPNGGSLTQLGFFKWIEKDSIRSFQLDIIVLEMALQHLNDFPSLKISINVSALSASIPSFAKRYVQIILASKISVERISIEVTETKIVGLPALLRINRFLKALKKIGVKSYVDDFRLWDLYRLWFFTHASTAKVDRSVVLKGRLFVRLAVRLARMNFKEVVVEGVEETKMLQLVQSLGCLAQGFHEDLGKPQPLDQFISLNR